MALYRERNSFIPEKFWDEFNTKLGEIVLNQFPLTLNNFNHTFDQFVSTIAEAINKHALLKCLSHSKKAMLVSTA